MTVLTTNTWIFTQIQMQETIHSKDNYLSLNTSSLKLHICREIQQSTIWKREYSMQAET